MKPCTRSFVAITMAAGLTLSGFAIAQDAPADQKINPPGGHEGRGLRQGMSDNMPDHGDKAMPGMAADHAINAQLAKFAANPEQSGDQKFALMAGCGNMAEVEFSKVVAEKASDPQVKQLAEMMVKEHSAAQGKLAPIGEKLGVTYPSELPTTKQLEQRYLSNLPVDKMEKAYLAMMKSDHLKTVSEYTDHIPMIKDADLKAYATETLAKVRAHTAEVLKVAQAKGMPIDLKFDNNMAMAQ